MTKTRKVTSNLQRQISELRKSRNKIEEFEYNFFFNFCENSKFIHYQIRSEIPNSLFWVGYRQYFVFLVSSIETFFRDLFVYLSSKDKSVLNKIVRETGIKNSEIAKLHSDEEIAELLSQCFNFQNFDDIGVAFSKILGTEFWDFIANHEIKNCVIGNKKGNFKLSNLFPNWKKTFNESLEIRHKVIHDANFRPSQNTSLIREAEGVFLIIPQIISRYFADKFNLKCLEINIGRQSFPYMLNVHDILAEDWETCDDDEQVRLNYAVPEK